MKNGICPKCVAKKVHIYTKTAVEVAVSVSWMNTAFLDYYICTNCGYVEMFVHDDEMLPRIAEKYPKVKIK